MELAQGVIQAYGLSPAIPQSLVKKILVDRINAAYHGKSKVPARSDAVVVDKQCKLDTATVTEAHQNLAATFDGRRTFIKSTARSMQVSDILTKYPFLCHPVWVRSLCELIIL